MKNVVVVAYGRSAVAKSGKKGALRQTHPVELGGQVLKGLLEKKLPQLDTALIEDVIVGCAQQDQAQSFNIARLIASAAGLPHSVPGMSLNRFCSSGIQAIAVAAGQIEAGLNEILVAGGVQSYQFAILAIALPILKKANMSKKVALAAMSAGGGSVVYGTLAAMPTALNVAPTSYLGTTTAAGLGMSLVCSVFTFGFVIWYLIHLSKKCRKNGEERFQHQYFDDTNLIKNMIFDIEVPTIAAYQGSGFHWDSAILCDITICADNVKFDDPHLQYGLVPGDGMGLLMQTLLGTKQGAYRMYTSRQWTAQEALERGWVSEVVPYGTVLDRAWEIARMIKTVPYETRTITSYLAKRPLEWMYVKDLKLHTVNEQLSTMIKIAQGDLGEHGKGQMDEAYHGLYARWRYDNEVMDMLDPQTEESWNIHERAVEWTKEHPKGY